MKTESLPCIAIAGNGNVATHLYRWLNTLGCEVSKANSRTLEDLDTQADICLIAVSDSAIGEVASAVDAKLEKDNAIIAHTAGSMPLSLLEGRRHKGGVFYPMQTFTKDRELEYASIPVFVEGATTEVEDQLLDLAKRMTDNAHLADTKTRAHIHLGAVFACNYVNYMLYLADKAVKECNLSLDIYKPLVEETVAKAMTCGPYASQTGPARRADLATLWTHMDLLQNHPHMSRVCRLLSQQILNLYKEK